MYSQIITLENSVLCQEDITVQASERRRVLAGRGGGRGGDCIAAVLLCHMKVILSDAINALITVTTV